MAGRACSSGMCEGLRASPAWTHHGDAAAASQSEEAENIGYVIPPPVIHHFITDFERNGRYTAFPSLGVEWQKMESPFLRTALRMSVRVVRTDPCHDAGMEVSHTLSIRALL